MGNALTLDHLALWRQIRADGGWWTARSLTRHWAPTFALWEVEDLIAALVGGGWLAARQDVIPGQTSVAFTSDCRLLPGESTASTEAKNEEENNHA